MNNTDRSVSQALGSLGLSTDQVDVYLACLSGGGTAAEIAKQAQINRTVVYRHLEELSERGLVHVGIAAGKRTYVAAKPDILTTILRQNLSDVESVLPLLLATYASNEPSQLKLRFYTDVAGIKTVMEEILNCEHKFYRVIGAFYDKQFRTMLSTKYLKDWAVRRIERGVSHQGLRPDVEPADRKELGPLFMDSSKEVLREFRTIPISADLPLLIFLFDDKVSLVGARMGHAYAAVLDSKDLFTVLNTIFELLWTTAKPAPQVQKR